MSLFTGAIQQHNTIANTYKVQMIIFVQYNGSTTLTSEMYVRTTSEGWKNRIGQQRVPPEFTSERDDERMKILLVNSCISKKRIIRSDGRKMQKQNQAAAAAAAESSSRVYQ